jgi:hypothetical protein
MYLGLTPVDTGYTFAGYVIAGTLLSYLKPVMVSVVLGSLIWMVYHSLLKHSLQPLITYFIPMFLVVSIFLPKTSPPACISSVESKASISSRDVAQNIIGQAGDSTSLGLVWIGRFLDSLAMKTAQLIESGGAIEKDGQVVGGVPFLYARTYTEIMRSKIEDPRVREEFTDFLANYYTPALQNWNNAGRPNLGIGQSILYPGDLVNAYGTPEARSKWAQIENDVYNDLVGHKTWWEKITSRITPTALKRWAIARVMKNELADRDTINSVSAKILANSTYFQSANNPLSLLVGYAEKGITTFITHIISMFAYLLTDLIIPTLPVIQGMLNMVILVAFPFVLLFSLFPNNFAILPKYFLTMLWVKSLTIAWAIVNCFQHLGWVFASSQGQNVFSWTLGGVPIIGALAGIFVLPFLFFKIISEGLAYMEEVGTRLVERGTRSVEKVSSMATE